jgi:hypothetical protein
MGPVWEAWEQQVQPVVADLEDRELAKATERVAYWLKRDLLRAGELARDERAVRGLGDPALTSAAPDAAVGHAGELVGRGHKTRGAA